MNQQHHNLLAICLATLLLFSLFVGADESLGYQDKVFNKAWTFTVKSDQLMIKYDRQALQSTGQSVEAIAGSFQLEKIEDGLENLDFAVYAVPAGRSSARLAEDLRQLPGVRSVAMPVIDQDGFTKYYVPDELTLQFQDYLSESQMLSIISKYDMSIVRDHWTPGYYTLRLPAGENPFVMIREMIALPEVMFSELNVIGFNDAAFVPNDALYPNQWAMNNTGQSGGTPGADINVEAAWDITRGTASVLVGIVDTGIDWDHEDLQANIWNNLGEDADNDGHTMEFNGSSWVMDPGDLNGVDDDGNGAVDDLIGWDFGSGDNNPDDTGSHGTACAGIAAAVADNGLGVAGVANQCQIMPLKVNLTSGQNANRADAINYAASFIDDYDGIVLSCSWRMSTGDFTAVELACLNAKSAGVVLCFSAGNDNVAPPSYPARYETTLAVGGTSPCDERKSPSSCDPETFWGASFGDELSVSAPAVLIQTTDMTVGGYDGGKYFATFNGTSSACPHVAGASALVMSRHAELNPGAPKLTPDEVQQILESTADKVGGYNYNYDGSRPGASFELGYGRINVQAALLAVGGVTPGGIDCDDVGQFVARCRPGGTIQSRIRFFNSSYDGQTVEFLIDGTDQLNATVANSRAQISAAGYGVGAHTVEIMNTEPAGCLGTLTINCTSISTEDPTLLGNLTLIPETMLLEQNYPNPFNPSTRVRYGLSEETHVSLKIYNSLGQEIAALVDDYQSAGYNTVEWNGRDANGRAVSSGIYIYRLVAGDFTASYKMLLSR